MPLENFGTACGTAAFWQDYYRVPFKGDGDYVLCTYFCEPILIVKITKSHRIPTPKDYDESKAHDSIKKYAYGQMFFGEFLGESNGW